MDKQPSGIEITHDDPRLTYSLAEQKRLTINLDALTRDIHGGAYRDRRIDIDLLCDLHGRIFASVREDFSGRIRTRGRGSEYLTFGPHRSARNVDVERELARAMREFQHRYEALRAYQGHPDFVHAAIRTAAWIHAEIIRVHPFEDGNGRSSRALMSVVLVNLGLPPIPIEVPKQEYLASLNHYMTSTPRDLGSLVDLLIRLLTE